MSMEEEFQKYSKLFDRANSNFYQSRRLLAVSIAPQITTQYALSIGSSNPITILSYQSFGEKQQKKELCKFLLDSKVYICEFSKKKKKLQGKFFGAVIQIRAIDGTKSRIYYLKAHRGYPITNNKDRIFI